jgi:hypothetical protein
MPDGRSFRRLDRMAVAGVAAEAACRVRPDSVRPDRLRVSDEYERNQLLPPAFALGGNNHVPRCDWVT